MNYILTVINPESQDLLTTICNQLELPLTTIARGEGTADDSIRDLFGIDYPKDKRIVACLASPEKTQELLKAQKRYLDIDAPGHGMTAVIPVKSVGGRSVLSWLLRSDMPFNPSKENHEMETSDMNNKTTAGTSKVDFMNHPSGASQGIDPGTLVDSANSSVNSSANSSESSSSDSKLHPSHELILCIANNGATDAVMAAARKAGAHGGTVIHGKGTGDRNTPRFYNVTISSEKEIILILSRTETRNSIMQTILKEAGPSTPAGAIVFSLPVTTVAGIDE